MQAFSPSFLGVLLSPLGPLPPPEQRNIEKTRTVALKYFSSLNTHSSSDVPSPLTLNKNSVKQIYALLDKDFIDYPPLLAKVVLWKKDVGLLISLFDTFRQPLVDLITLLPILLYPTYLQAATIIIRTSHLSHFKKVTPTIIDLRDDLIDSVIEDAHLYLFNKNAKGDPSKKIRYAKALSKLATLQAYLDNSSSSLKTSLYSSITTRIIKKIWFLEPHKEDNQTQALAYKIMQDAAASNFEPEVFQKIFWANLNDFQEQPDFKYKKLILTEFQNCLREASLNLDASTNEKNEHLNAVIQDMEDICFSLKFILSNNIVPELLWLGEASLKNLAQRLSQEDPKTNLLLLATSEFFYSKTVTTDTLTTVEGIKEDLLEDLEKITIEYSGINPSAKSPIDSFYLDVLNKTIHPTTPPPPLPFPPHFHQLGHAHQLLKPFTQIPELQLHQEAFILASCAKSDPTFIKEFRLYPEILHGQFNHSFIKIKPPSDPLFHRLWKIFHEEINLSLLPTLNRELTNWNHTTPQNLENIICNTFHSFAQKFEITPTANLDTLISNKENKNHYLKIVSLLQTEYKNDFDNPVKIPLLNTLQKNIFSEQRERVFLERIQNLFIEYGSFKNFKWINQTGQVFSEELKTHKKKFPSYFFFFLPYRPVVASLSALHEVSPLLNAAWQLQTFFQQIPINPQEIVFPEAPAPPLPSKGKTPPKIIPSPLTEKRGTISAATPKKTTANNAASEEKEVEKTPSPIFSTSSSSKKKKKKPAQLPDETDDSGEWLFVSKKSPLKKEAAPLTKNVLPLSSDAPVKKIIQNQTKEIAQPPSFMGKPRIIAPKIALPKLIPCPLMPSEEVTRTISPFAEIFSSSNVWSQVNAQKIREFLIAPPAKLFIDESISHIKNWSDLLLLSGTSAFGSSKFYQRLLTPYEKDNPAFEILPTLAFCYLLCFEGEHYHQLVPLVIHLNQELDDHTVWKVYKEKLLELIKENVKPTWNDVSKWVLEEISTRSLSFRYLPPEIIQEYVFLFAIFLDPAKISKKIFQEFKQIYLSKKDPLHSNQALEDLPGEFQILLSLFNGLDENICYFSPLPGHPPSETSLLAQTKCTTILSEFLFFQEHLEDLLTAPTSFAKILSLMGFSDPGANQTS